MLHRVPVNSMVLLVKAKAVIDTVFAAQGNNRAIKLISGGARGSLRLFML